MYFLDHSILVPFWNWIQPLDEWLLLHINGNWSNAVLDTLLPFFRETLFWYPLYGFLLLFMVSNFSSKGWWWVLAVVLTAATADLLSSQVIKELFFRLRPCQDPEVNAHIRFLIIYCPKSSSFTSSHATSHFAQAMFFYQTLKTLTRYAGFFFLWAACIAYTQVYVGVHYPSDVLIGGLIGCGIGNLMAKIYHKQAGLLSLATN
ncbi:MAG: hypothetical protein RL732_1550 [Bacteroidota bacterium]|jgi:undecaprenyl-diphosphatase